MGERSEYGANGSDNIFSHCSEMEPFEKRNRTGESMVITRRTATRLAARRGREMKAA